MKSKQPCPKSVRPASTQSPASDVNKQRVRCSLCDVLLKASSTHRYAFMGKSVHEKLNQTITYGQCCQQYFTGMYDIEQLHLICPKCCHDLQRVYALHTDAEQLTDKIRHAWHKTKRLNRARRVRPSHPSPANRDSGSLLLPTPVVRETMRVPIKEEMSSEESSATDLTVGYVPPYELPSTEQEHAMKNSPQTCGNEPIAGSEMKLPRRTYANKSGQAHQMGPSSSLPSRSARRKASNSHGYYLNTPNPSTYPASSPSFAQLMIESPSSSSSPAQRLELPRESSPTGDDRSLDDDRSQSPTLNDDDNPLADGPKSTRLSRRQYNFLVKLADQQSLNAFIETSSSESGSRWTWRRTSANSRGYKVYYVCNFSMRRHYHPCPAAMYALFHPEGNISIYSCGQHQHVPKDRLPVSITDATKDEIFKCLQAGMTTTDIREHLTRLQLPFGDTRKLNNFIKYHKELLRFGTVTNVRVGGTAYRQPQCWAIRRQPSAPESANNDESKAS